MRGRCATFGTIYWMLNAAWPSVNWNLFPSTFQPGGAFFGAQDANEPLHIAYDYATRRVDIVNSTLHGRSGLTASAEVYDIPDLRRRLALRVPDVVAPANAAATVFRLPPVSRQLSYVLPPPTAARRGGQALSDNLYWYSKQPDVLSGHHSWFRTPVDPYADLTGLERLPTNTDVAATARRRSQWWMGDGSSHHHQREPDRYRVLRSRGDHGRSGRRRGAADPVLGATTFRCSQGSRPRSPRGTGAPT